MGASVVAIEELLDQAEEALDRAAPEEALRFADRALTFNSTHPGAWFVRGDALRALSRDSEAAEAYRSAALADPGHSSSWAALSTTCFDLLRFDEASRAAARALREDPRNPEAWWARSLLLEWKGDKAGRRRALTRARWLEPDSFLVPHSLSDEVVEGIVEEAVGSLHPDLQAWLANVAILLEDLPREDILRSYDPPASPLDLLGYFSGHSLVDRSMDNPWSNLPPTITLFRNNLERMAADREQIIEELRITLFHEIGHFLGLDEEDLAERGLD